MGYRSEVYLGVDKRVTGELLTFATINPECYTLLFQHSEYAKKTKKGGLHFGWEYIKWYDDFVNVSKLMNWVEENITSVRFLRIGENSDDVQEMGHSDEYHYQVTRKVEVQVFDNED